MALIKNEIPILEYDDNPVAVLMPGRSKKNIRLPKKAVFAFLRESIDEYAKANDAQVVTEFISMTKLYPIYIVNYQGEEICLCQAPVGAPAAAQILDWLIAYGAEQII
ncbi:MAG: phosphorylase, partial [Clostridia bacterium]|nr:phosphorylase [Clostridia bacterium]